MLFRKGSQRFRLPEWYKHISERLFLTGFHSFLSRGLGLAAKKSYIVKVGRFKSVFVCMGLANMANSDSMKRVLHAKGLLPFLTIRKIKNSVGIR